MGAGVEAVEAMVVVAGMDLVLGMVGCWFDLAKERRRNGKACGGGVKIYMCVY